MSIVSLDSLNISWSVNIQRNATQTYNFQLFITNSTHTRVVTLSNSHYILSIFNTPPYPPCDSEVYNFSVTATPVGATYTGEGCSSSEIRSIILPSLRIENVSILLFLSTEGLSINVSFEVSVHSSCVTVITRQMINDLELCL